MSERLYLRYKKGTPGAGIEAPAIIINAAGEEVETDLQSALGEIRREIDELEGEGVGTGTSVGNLVFRSIKTVSNFNLPTNNRWAAPGIVIPEGAEIILIDLGDSTDDYRLIHWARIRDSLQAGTVGQAAAAGQFETVEEIGATNHLVRVGHDGNHGLLLASGEGTASNLIAEIRVAWMLAPIGSDVDIDAILDALIGDDTDAIHASDANPASKAFNLDAATVPEGTGKASAKLDNLLPLYPFADAFATLVRGGADMDIRIQGATSGSQGGFDPEIKLSVTFTSDTDSAGVTVERSIDYNAAFDETFPMPASVRDGAADGDDFYAAFSVTVETRGRAAGTVRVFEATLHAVGTHELEFERLIDGRIAPETAARQREDADLQRQITENRTSILSDRQKRILALFTLVQEMLHDPFLVAARTGNSGAFGAEAATYKPTGTTINVQIPAVMPDQELALVARQADDAGTLQDYPFHGRGIASGNNIFTYRFVLPNTNVVSFFHIRSEDALLVKQQVAELIEQMQDVLGELTPNARAFLEAVRSTHIQTSDVQRTTLLPDLTLSRETLTGSSSPFSSPAPAGGEVIIGVNRVRPRTQIQASEEQDLLEAYLNDANRIALVRMSRGANGYAGITVPTVVPARPAYVANSRVNLFNINQQRAADAFDLRLSQNGSAIIEAQDFLVPDSVPANTQVTIPNALEGNEDGNLHRSDFTVAVGGAATTAAQTHTFEIAGRNEFTVSAQYIVDGGRKIVRVIARPATGRTIFGANWVWHFGAYYTSQANIPATAERLDRIFVRGGYSSNIGLAMAIKVVAGKIVLVLEPGTSRFLNGGEFNTGLDAADYGLQAGGTGVLRFSGEYNEIVKVSAGDPDPSDMAVLRGQVDNRNFGIGLFTNVTEEDEVFDVGRGIMAPRFLTPDGELGDGTGARRIAVTDQPIAAAAAASTWHSSPYTILPTGSQAFRQGASLFTMSNAGALSFNASGFYLIELRGRITVTMSAMQRFSLSAAILRGGTALEEGEGFYIRDPGTYNISEHFRLFVPEDALGGYSIRLTDLSLNARQGASCQWLSGGVLEVVRI